MRGLAISLLVLLSACATPSDPADAPGPVALRHRTVALDAGLSGVDLAELRRQLAARGDGVVHGLVQAWRIPTDADRARLAADGIVLQDPVGDRTYIALLDGDVLRRPLHPDLRFLGAIHPSDRLATPWAHLVDSDLALTAHADMPLDRLAELIEQGGGTIIGLVPPVHAVLARAEQPLLESLVQRDQVVLVEPLSDTLDDLLDEVREAMGVESLHADGYTGVGQVIAISEGARADDTHIDLADRFLSVNEAATGDHATHVAGICAGEGDGSDAENRGVAPGAKLVSFGHADSAGLAVLDWLTMVSAHDPVVLNNSWGHDADDSEACDGVYPDFGEYEFLARLTDALSRSPGVTVVFAAGNNRNSTAGRTTCRLSRDSWENYGTTTSQSAGKSALVVGAAEDDGDVAAYSAFGPTADGRLSPIVIAPGNSVTSTVPTDDYGTMSGTSMAAPAVAGTVALLAEAHQRRAPAADPLLPAHHRAILAQTADDNLGKEAALRFFTRSADLVGPDFQSGYGNVDANAAVALVESGAYTTGSFTGTGGGMTASHELGVPPGLSALKVTLAWDDAPSGALASPEDPLLVNHIDMVLVDPDGVTWGPWFNDPDDPHAPATSAWVTDPMNTIKQVLVTGSLTPGTWTVELVGSISATGGQSYALVANVELEQETTVPDRYATITEALHAGERDITVGAGTYTEDLSLSDEVSITGAGRDETVIVGEITTDGVNQLGSLTVRASGTRAIDVTSGDDLTVIDVLVEEASDDCIFVDNDAILDISDSEVRACGDDGIHAYGASVTGVRLFVHGNGSAGLNIDDDLSDISDLTLSASVIADNGDEGIRLDGSDLAADNLVIAESGTCLDVAVDADNVASAWNTAFVGCPIAAQDTSSTPALSLGYVAFWDNTVDLDGVTSVSGATLTEDPLFVQWTKNGNAHDDDFHLLEGSPLLDGGDPDPAFDDAVYGAVDGDTVVADLGAYGGPDGLHDGTPVAWPGRPMHTWADTTVVLDGSGSHDPDDDALLYLWQVQDAPSGSAAAVVDPTAPQALFTPDLAGEYTLQLTVTDTAGDSHAALLTLTAWSDVVDLETVVESYAGADSQVWMPTGEHEATLSLQPGQSLIGQGASLSTVLGRIYSSDFVWIEDLTVHATGSEAVTIDGGDHASLRHCIVQGSSNHGVYADDARLNISDCELRENGGYGLVADNTILTMTRTVVHSNDDGGIDLDDGLSGDGTDAVITATLVAENGGTGLNLGDARLDATNLTIVEHDTCVRAWSADAGPITIWNSVIASCGLGVDATDGSDVETGYVAWHDNDTDRSGVAAGAGAMTGDPLFVAYSVDDNFYNDDLHPHADSPLWDAGDPDVDYDDSVFGDAWDDARADVGWTGGPDADWDDGPVAWAGRDMHAWTDRTVTLYGVESHDPDSDPLTYAWTIVAAPSGSTAAISDATAALPTFAPDMTGSWTFALTVDDGLGESAADQVNLTVHGASTTLEDVVEGLAGPEEVIYPATGTHSATWTLQDGQFLIGAGAGSTILQGRVYVTGRNWLSSLTVQGSTANNVDVSSGDIVHVEDCVLTGANDSGLYVDNGQATVVSSWLVDNSYAGLHQEDGKLTLQGVHLSGNDYGMRVRDGVTADLSGVVAADNGRYGIWLDDSDVVLANFTTVGNDLGLYLSGGSGSYTLLNGIVTHNAGEGLYAAVSSSLVSAGWIDLYANGTDLDGLSSSFTGYLSTDPGYTDRTDDGDWSDDDLTPSAAALLDSGDPDILDTDGSRSDYGGTAGPTPAP